MAKARRGRKMKQGDRFPCGKLRQAYDYGCDGVIKRRAIYAMTAANDGGEVKVVADHTFDAIGRAWSAGLLQAEGRDPAAMRDAGRDLGSLYWRIYGLATPDSLARFQAQTGGMTSEEREKALENALSNKLEAVKRAGTNVRSAIDSVCIGDGMSTDHGPAWLDRLIWAKRHGKPVLPLDQVMLDKVNRGLAALC